MSTTFPKILIAMPGDREYNSIEDLDTDNRMVCPMCGKLSAEEDGLQTDEYVSCPMVWCEHCGARCVVDTKTFRNITFEEARKEFPKHVDELVKTPRYDYAPYVFMTANCAYIERIANFQLYNYKLEKDNYLSESQISDFVSIQLKPYKIYKGVDTSKLKQEFEDLRQSLNIFRRDKEEMDTDDFLSNSDLFKLSLPVQSYNVEDPKQPYPSNMDLRHDGIYIYLLCRDNTGKSFTMVYWGD